MKEERLNVLIIDDDSVYRNLIKNILSDNFKIFDVETPSKAFTILKKETIDIIFCDYLLPEMNGLKVLAKLNSEFPEIEVIMISASGDIDTVIEALRLGAADYIRKSSSTADIWLAIERTKKLSTLTKNLHKTKKKNVVLETVIQQKYDIDIIGKSAEIQNVKKLINPHTACRISIVGVTSMVINNRSNFHDEDEI